MGLAGTPATTAITSSLCSFMAKQGVASAVDDTARELGSAFGIAILGSVLNQSYRAGMTDAARGLPPLLADTRLSLHRLHGVTRGGAARRPGTGVLGAGPAREAFVQGVTDALLLGAGILILGVPSSSSGDGDHARRARQSP